MANKQVKIKKIRENSVLPIKNNGNWYDLQTSAMICMQQHNIDWKLDEHKKALIIATKID